MDTANAWLPGYIADYNRRFAVNPKDISDAHLPYTGTRETLTSILPAGQAGRQVRPRWVVRYFITKGKQEIADISIWC